MGYLLKSKEEYILYGGGLPPVKIDNNLIFMLIEDADVTIDMLNGKVNKLWVQDVPVSLTTKQKYQLTLQLYN